MGIDTETEESLFVGREDELEVLTSSFVYGLWFGTGHFASIAHTGTILVP